MPLAAQTLNPPVLAALKSAVSADCFKSVFKDAAVIGRSGDALQIGVPTRYAKNYIENHYSALVLRAVQDSAPEIARVEFVVHSIRRDAGESTSMLGQVLSGTLPAAVKPEPVGAQNPQSPSQPAGMQTAEQNGSRRSTPDGFAVTPLAARLRLENFVHGRSTRVALAAAQSVAESPAAVYNPLFIHGPHGLGKTHLLHGIGHLLRERRPPLSVIYLSCEEFTNLYVQAVQTKRLEAFRARFRGCDTLLVDDIQFLAGKERTQDEFLHTFDALRNNQKQVVLCADVPPRELKRIDAKLLTRFVSGLVTHVDVPDLALRQELVQVKARQRGLSLNADVVDTLAAHIVSNVRELEGAVCKLMALASSEGRTPDRELAIIALRELGYLRSGPVTLADILAVVSHHYGVSTDEMRGDKRLASIVHARHVGMYLAKQLTSVSVVEIGRFYGSRNHATVLHAARKVADVLKRDEALRRDIEHLRQVLGR